jgi:hypothetical protein
VKQPGVETEEEGSMEAGHESERAFLRHALATVAYRGAKVVRDAPAGFADFKVGPSSRTPGQILAHICDLFDWALRLSKGQHQWKESQPEAWEQDSARLFMAIRDLDEYLASDAALGCPIERLFQGPVADALTHIGQIAMLRRLADSHIRSENYFKANIEAGKI